MPAIRATASASPFGTVPSRRAATQAGLSRTRPAAVAVRSVSGLPDTSTIRASPVALRCGKLRSLIVDRLGSLDDRLVEQPDVDALPGRHELGVLSQDHQRVRPGQTVEQVRAVTTRELDLAGPGVIG